MSSDPQRHVYGDIEEEDNRLPNWWMFILLSTMVFGFGYWFVYHTTKTLPTPNEEYRVAVDELNKARIAANPMSDEAIIALAKDQTTIEAGHQVFVSTCAACHGQKAEGLVGPNLTDKFWIHGNKPSQIIKSVTDGYADKGMPPWGRILGDDKVRKVAAYVLTLKNTNVTGKAPQGDPVED